VRFRTVRRGELQDALKWAAALETAIEDGRRWLLDWSFRLRRFGLAGVPRTGQILAHEPDVLSKSIDLLGM